MDKIWSYLILYCSVTTLKKKLLSWICNEFLRLKNFISYWIARQGASYLLGYTRGWLDLAHLFLLLILEVKNTLLPSKRFYSIAISLEWFAKKYLWFVSTLPRYFFRWLCLPKFSIWSDLKNSLPHLRVLVQSIKIVKRTILFIVDKVRMFPYVQCFSMFLFLLIALSFAQ